MLVTANLEWSSYERARSHALDRGILALHLSAAWIRILNPLTCKVVQSRGYSLSSNHSIYANISPSPSLVSYGSPLGLEEIQGEQSTHDGEVLDPLSSNIPNILAGNEAMLAVDGLQFAGRDTLFVFILGCYVWYAKTAKIRLAYHAGVTSAITPPTSQGLVAGLSTAFSTGAAHALQEGAVIQDIAALHVNVGYSGSRSPSVSSQIAALRHLLLDAPSGTPFDRVAKVNYNIMLDFTSFDCNQRETFR